MLKKLNRQLFGLFVALFLALPLVVVVGCDNGDKGDVGQDDTYNPGPKPGDGGKNDPGPGGGGSPATTYSVAFDLNGATALMAQEDTVQNSDAKQMSAKDGRALLNYEIVNQGLSADYKKANGAQKSVLRAESGTGSSEGGSNLLAVDEYGNATLAIDTDAMIKVMFSVLDPSGEYVYLALETGWDNWDGNDYSQFIAQQNCALFKVSITDNSFNCVQEGVFVKGMDENYQQMISGNQKPIQFDAEGNVYYNGTAFDREENTWDNCYWDDQKQKDVCETYTDYWINWGSWNGIIYKVDAGTGDVSNISQDNGSVEFFTALATGELVYQVRDIDNWEAQLYMYQNGLTIDLSGGSWGVNFFAPDTKNAVMWGSWEEPGLRFARPKPDGTFGAQKATLDTNLFGGNNWGDSTPTRIMVADDGRIYGTFQSWFWDQETETSFQRLTVYQILPFNGTPKLELDLPDTGLWWDMMGKTPFQVAKGYLFYTEEYDAADGLGTRDVIKLIRLEDRQKATLLSDQLLEIYTWRLSGDNLYFSALNKLNTVVVTGKIDVNMVKNGAATNEYLLLQETASASGATSAIRDIEVLTPKPAAVDNNEDPVVSKFHATSENLYSVSLDFSKDMDKDSVEENLSFADASGDEKDVMKIWVHKTLHLVPDLDGLLNASTTTPMSADTTYDVEIGSGAMDIFGRSISDDSGANPTAVSFKTRPNTGWYLKDTDVEDSLLTQGQIATYAGSGIDDWNRYAYNLEATLPQHFRIDFSAVNYGWDGIGVMVVDTNRQPTYNEDIWMWDNKYFLYASLNNWSDIQYETDQSSQTSYQRGSQWANTPSLFNGQWQRYRIDVFGGEVHFYHNETDPDDADAWKELTSIEITDAADRTDADGNFTGSYTVIFTVNQPLGFDNLVITKLLETGDPSTDTIDATSDTYGDEIVVLSEGFDDFGSIQEIGFLSKRIENDDNLIYINPATDGHKSAPVDIDREVAEAGSVGALDTSYYQFHLNWDWTLTGAYMVNITDVVPVSANNSLIVTHYEEQAIDANLKTVCDATSAACAIWVQNDWANQIISVANDSTADVTYNLTVEPAVDLTLDENISASSSGTVHARGNNLFQVDLGCGWNESTGNWDNPAGNYWASLKDITPDSAAENLKINHYIEPEWWDSTMVSVQTCEVSDSATCNVDVQDTCKKHIFNIVNDGTTDVDYTFNFKPALGSPANPTPIYLGTELSGGIGGNKTKNYEYIPDADGAVWVVVSNVETFYTVDFFRRGSGDWVAGTWEQSGDWAQMTAWMYAGFKYTMKFKNNHPTDTSPYSIILVEPDSDGSSSSPMAINLDSTTDGQVLPEKDDNTNASYYSFTTSSAGDYTINIDPLSHSWFYLEVFDDSGFSSGIDGLWIDSSLGGSDLTLSNLSANTTYYFKTQWAWDGQYYKILISGP